ncbi:MAG: acetoin utilization protein AcuC [Dissulfurispiraceae bacterium]
MKTAFIYTDDFLKFNYGIAHPLKVSRLQLTFELIKAYGLLSLPNTQYVEATKAADDALLLFHSKQYLELLKTANYGKKLDNAAYFGIGPGDNPTFEGLLDWSKLVAGASLKAAALVDSGEVDIAFSISGGLHHAMASRASGFCYVNDIVILIMSLLQKGRRIAYIDIDAHHADGVQTAFQATDRVLTISIHETGRTLFPGSGFEYEIGTDKGKGYSVNVPMPPSSDDRLFVFAFNEIVPPLIGKFRPDIIVSQLGVDSFRSDPLAHLNYTTEGFCHVIRRIKEISPKWVALGGGGYDVTNVARAWTLAWAIMNGVEIPDEIPEDFLERHMHEGFKSRKIRDETCAGKSMKQGPMIKEIERIIVFIKKNVFPLITGPT